MKIAIIGASGKTGKELVRLALDRGNETVGLCRDSSIAKLDEFSGRDGFTVMTAPEVSDESMLINALADCDAAVAIPLSVHRLKATVLVAALSKATTANRLKRVVFTAGEVTAIPEANETPTFRQHLMLLGFTVISWFTPYSLSDMRNASAAIKQQTDWDWTIVRAPTLSDAPPTGYRFCKLSEITSKHVLARKDYAACLLDVLERSGYARRMLTVMPRNEGGR